MFLYFYYFCLQDSRNFPVTKYSAGILKKNFLIADGILSYFLYIGKNNNKKKFFTMFVHILYTHTHTHTHPSTDNKEEKKKRRAKTSHCYKHRM